MILDVVRSSINLWFLIKGSYVEAGLICFPLEVAGVIGGLLALLILSVASSAAYLDAGLVRHHGSKIRAAIQITSLGQIIAGRLKAYSPV